MNLTNKNKVVLVLSSAASEENIHAAFDAATTFHIFEQPPTLVITCGQNTQLSTPFLFSVEAKAQVLLDNFDNTSIYATDNIKNKPTFAQIIAPEKLKHLFSNADSIVNF